MWHEARKHEKKLRGMMIDYRKRAERRRDFYESIRRDPASYLQIHGHQMKIHIDPIISQAAESSLMPWMGDSNNLIDRFDVRAHLDYIPTSADVSVTGADSDYQLTADQECQLNYERYRNLIQNDFLNITEQKYLHQIYLEERGQNLVKQQSKQDVKKKLAEKRAAIGYTYEDSESAGISVADNNESESDSEAEEEEFEDIDTTVHIDQLNNEMCHRINLLATKYGLKDSHFVKFLDLDKAESEKLRIAKEIENDKAMFAGRKSKRERKELRQQRLLILRSINVDDSGLDHFGKEAKQKMSDDKSDSDSSEDDDSKGELEDGKIEFITCFGNSTDEEEVQDKVKKKSLDKKSKSKPKVDKKDNLKDLKKKSLKQKQVKDDTCSNFLPMYGPTLPITKETKSPVEAGIKFNSTNKSQTKQRHYRYTRDSDEDRIESKRSPIYRPRRSPSVRRKRYSSDDSSDKSRSRSNSRTRYYRRHSRDRSISKDRRYRSRSRSRSKHSRSNRYLSRRSISHERIRQSRKRSRSKSPRRSRYDRRKSRSRSRSSFKDRNRRSDRNRRKSSTPSHSRHSRSNKRSRDSRSHSRSRADSYRKNDTKLKQSPTDANKLTPVKSSNIILDNSEAKEKAKFSTVSNVVTVIKTDDSMKTLPPLEEKISNFVANDNNLKTVEPPPIKKYYRHDLEKELSDEELVGNIEEKKSNQTYTESSVSVKNSSNNSNQSLTNKTITSSPNLAPNVTKNSVITPQERLKRLMQAQLDKQFHLDKKAAAEKLEKQKQEQLERDEELHKMTSRLQERRKGNLSSRSRSRSSSSSSSSRSSIDSDSTSSGDRRRRRRRSSSSHSRRHYRSRSKSQSRSNRRYQSSSRRKRRFSSRSSSR